MSDKTRVEGEIDLNVGKAVRALNDLIDKLADLDRRGPAAAKAIDTVERSATRIQSALKAGTTSVQQQTAAIRELQNQYRALNSLGLKNTGGITSRLNNAVNSANLQSQEAAYKSYFKNIEAAQKSSLSRQQQAAYQTYAQNMPAALKVSQRAAYDSYAQNIAFSKQQESLNRGLANQRYALYDVATSFGVVSAATLGAATAVTVVGINYEKAFSQVERTTQATGSTLTNLRKQLVDLSMAVPVSFEELSGIAALGGQLGVAADGIDDFTATVAKLTATTNLTAEAAGTALGRFDALFKDIDPSNFEALGSAILKVGVNSVATESQIVGTAVQISSMGDFAGLTAEQVVGLSGALASVGAQPELARGTVTRVFTQMSTAISAGGDSLETFARLSGVSAEQFKATWGTPQFADTFQSFLRGIESEGQGAISTLNDLGVSSVRDIPLLLRLAGAQGVVTNAFNDAESGFKDNTELNKQYNITLQTVAAQLTIFGNTLKAAMDTVGGAALGPLSGVLEIFQNLAETLVAFGGTDVGKIIGVAVLALVTLVGALTGLRAIQALSIASAYAFTTAQEALGTAGMRSAASMGGLAKQMAMATIGTQRATAATTAYNAALTAGSSKAAAYGAGLRGAATGASGLGAALKSAAVAGGWLTAIGLGISILTSFATSSAEAKSNVEALTATLDEQTGALTENTAAWIAKKLEDQGILQTLREMGVSTQVAVAAVQGETAAIKEVNAQLAIYTQAQVDATKGGREGADALINAKNSTQAVQRSLGILTGQVEQSTEAWDRINEATGGAGNGMDNVDASAQDLIGNLQDLLDTQYDIIGGTVGVQNAIYALGSSLGENGNDFSAYSVAGRANLAALQQAMSAMVQASGGDANALATMIAGLMQTLAAQGVDTVNQLAFVQNALAQLTGGKGVGGLTGVNQAALQAGNALSQGFSSGAGKAAKAAKSAGRGAGSAAKEIKTLSDYVSDLSGVFKTAFDIRFGLESAIDSVSEGWQKMADSAEDARESIRDATQELIDSDATIQGLQASNNTLNYQLVVAQQYGDVLRATEILAEIAENNANITDEQRKRIKTEKDLAKAQAASIPSLDGQTEGSREQRDMVQGLVKSYQEQVLALANSGLSQQEVARRTQELKNQFVAQLTQLGYNRAEIDRYAAAFDDLTLAIQRVPRNITVSANTDPAQRAIDEFLAKNANRSVGLGGTLNVPDAGSTYAQGAAAGSAYADGWNAQMATKRRLTVQVDGSVPGGKRYSTDGGQTWFLRKGGQVGAGVQYHSTGGVHGMHPGAPKGTDTTAAWLTPGEFVMQRSAVQAMGLPFMNAINNQQAPKYMATGGGTSGGSSTPFGPTLVELMPSQLQQLASLLSTTLSMDGKIITEKVNNDNAVLARRGSN